MAKSIQEKIIIINFDELASITNFSGAKLLQQAGFSNFYATAMLFQSKTRTKFSKHEKYYSMSSTHRISKTFEVLRYLP
jgi:hypothetical protein